MIKNDWSVLSIFVLAVALLAALWGWLVGAAFAGGWMIRHYVWVKSINRELPRIVRAEVDRLVAHARASGGTHLN